MSTAGISEAGHGGDTLRLVTAGILCSWALQEYSAVGRCRNTLPSGTAGILWIFCTLGSARIFGS